MMRYIAPQMSTLKSFMIQNELPIYGVPVAEERSTTERSSRKLRVHGHVRNTDRVWDQNICEIKT